MLMEEDIVRIEPLSLKERMIARHYAKMAEMGGVSRIRGSKDRQRLLRLDQFIGVGIGELVGNKHFFTISHYCKSRRAKNDNPYDTDHGCDTPGFKIDYKASRLTHSRILDYHLPVRPAEYHQKHTYILILVDTHGFTDVDEIVSVGKLDVYLVGWATTDMLPEKKAGSVYMGGVFNGAYVLKADQLNPIHTLRVEDIATISPEVLHEQSSGRPD